MTQAARSLAHRPAKALSRQQTQSLGQTGAHWILLAISLWIAYEGFKTFYLISQGLTP